MKNRGSTPILTNLVGVHPRNIHTKFEANPCSGSREEIKQEKHHVWVQTARLYLYLIFIISNKYQNSGIFSKTKRKPEKVAKHIVRELAEIYIACRVQKV